MVNGEDFHLILAQNYKAILGRNRSASAEADSAAAEAAAWPQRLVVPGFRRTK